MRSLKRRVIEEGRGTDIGRPGIRARSGSDHAVMPDAELGMVAGSDASASAGAGAADSAGSDGGSHHPTRRTKILRFPMTRTAAPAPITCKKAVRVLVTLTVLTMCMIMIRRAVNLHKMVSFAKDHVEGIQERLPADYIPILLPVFNRPVYLKQVLAHLARAHNINQTVLIVSQDGSNRDVSRLVEAIDFMPVVRVLHIRPYFGLLDYVFSTTSLSDHIYFLLQLAFEHIHAPAAIVLEDDLLVSADFYDYFRWAMESIKESKELQDRVFTVGAFHKRSTNVSDPFKVMPYKHMTWGWMLPAHVWPLVSWKWPFLHDQAFVMEERIRKPSGRVSVAPDLSRTRNIGLIGMNFRVYDEDEMKEWLQVHISDVPIDYTGRKLVLPDKAAVEEPD